MKAIFHTLAISLLFFSCTHSAIDHIAPIDIHPFSSDGCTLHPDGIPLFKPDKWVHCCLAHDIDYWVGGSREARRQSDERLGQCVKEASFSFHGSMMKLAPRMGGKPSAIFPWRWGYGWNKNRKYTELNESLKNKVISKFDTVLPVVNGDDYSMTDNQKEYVIEYFDDFKSKIELSNEGPFLLP